MSLPSTDGLQALAAVAEHGVGAAAALGWTEQRLGESLAGLEELLGAQLVSPSFELTGAGLRLLPQARRSLAELARCRALLEGGLPRAFELTVGTRFELGLSWLVPSLDLLRQRRPERALHLVFGDSSELLSRLERGELDALVSSTRLLRPGLVREDLHREDYVFVGAPQLLGDTPLRGPDDAPAHVLVDTTGELPLFRYLLDALEGDAPWTFRRVERMGTIGAVRLRVLAGAGVAVLPRYFVQRDIDQGRLRPLLSWLRLREDSFRLIWRAGHLHDAELRQLVRELRDLELR